jgi:hypothetical protein
MKIRKELSGNNFSAYRSPVSLKHLPNLSGGGDDEEEALNNLIARYPAHIHRKRAGLHYQASDHYRAKGNRVKANDHERMGLMHEDAAGLREDADRGE